MTSRAGGRGCYPGSFDPLTVAHVAIAEAAIEQCGLTSLDLVVSRVALAKEAGHAASLDARVAAIEAATPWTCRVTGRQLLADIADGYDVLVVGADKWRQVLDPAFYGGSVQARDDALRRLPPVVAVAPRAGMDIELSSDGRVQVLRMLELPPWIGDVSSTAVRAGAHHWRAPQSSRSPHTPHPPQTRQGPE